jgi:hypothetical protein
LTPHSSFSYGRDGNERPAIFLAEASTIRILVGAFRKASDEEMEMDLGR